MTPQTTISGRAWAEIALLSLIWGGSFLAFSFALREIGVFTTVAFRVGGGALVLWIYALLRGLPVPRDPRIWGIFLVMGLLNNAIPFSLIAWGQLRVPSGLASILNASTAIFGVVVAAAVFADERLSARKLLAVALGFGGVATAIGLSSLTEFDPTSLAQLAIVGSSISYALAASWGRAYLKGVLPQIAALGMTTCSTLVMIPLALWVEGRPTLDYSPATWAAVLHLSVVATAVAYLLYYRVLAMAGAGNLAMVTLTVAPLAIILGAVVLGEDLPARAYTGFALLLAGLLVLDGRLLKTRKPHRVLPPAPPQG